MEKTTQKVFYKSSYFACMDFPFPQYDKKNPPIQSERISNFVEWFSHNSYILQDQTHRTKDIENHFRWFQQKINKDIHDWKELTEKKKFFNHNSEISFLFTYDEKQLKKKQLNAFLIKIFLKNKSRHTNDFISSDSFMRRRFVNGKYEERITRQTYLAFLKDLRNLKKPQLKKIIVENNYRFYPSYSKLKMVKSIMKEIPFDYNWNNYDRRENMKYKQSTKVEY